jgi:hypothetical protein
LNGRVRTRTTKYWLSNLPETTAFKELVRLAKLRWRIERDYQELKQELGLGHYEGRNWRGFHHHASLCIAAYAFIMSCRIAARSRKKTPLPRFVPLGGRATSARAGLPLRPERHAPHSIATVRIAIAVALVRRLPICPCCRFSMRRRIY